MTMKSRLGNQPDTNDMAKSLVMDSEKPATTPGLDFETEEEEEEAALPGDFA